MTIEHTDHLKEYFKEEIQRRVGSISKNMLPSELRSVPDELLLKVLADLACGVFRTMTTYAIKSSIEEYASMIRFEKNK